MPRPVTVGLDGSPESLAAADWAAREAILRGLPLHLVNAWVWPSYTVPSEAATNVRKFWAERVLHEAEADLSSRHPDLTITTEQLSGEIVSILLDAADKAELLVLGSRGIGAVHGYLLGSVSLQTLAQTHRPLVLVRAGARVLDAHPLRPDDRPADQGGAPDGEVVLGLPPRLPCDPPVEFAFEAASRRGAPLRAVHVWRPPPAGGYASVSAEPRMLAEIDEQARITVAEALRPWREKYPTVRVTEDVVRDSVARSLVRAAGRASLLVVGRRLQRAPRVMHIGPVVHAAVHHAPCPVAVVPHP